MALIPGTFDPPTYSPHLTAGLFGLGFIRQDDFTISGVQILAMDEGLAALHHHQIEGSVIAEHFGHGAAVAVFGLGADRHHRTDLGQLLQVLTGSVPIGGLGRLGGINARQADCQPLRAISYQQAISNPQGVSISHLLNRSSASRTGHQDQGQQGQPRASRNEKKTNSPNYSNKALSSDVDIMGCR